MTVITLIFILVILPALLGFCLYLEYLADGLAPTALGFLRDNFHQLFKDQIEPGDFLIYRKPKASPRPGPRARNVQASENGDDYYYEVDKFWMVSDVLDDGRLVAVTRTGKRVYVTPADERVRKAGWLDRLRYGQRFPAL
jgi:hypothetical protein